MRTRAYWNGLIDTALAALGLSSSAVADWKLLRDICITIAMALDGIWQLFQADIDQALATKQPGTLGWYAAISKAFQYGDSLIVTDGVVGYAADNAAARIISQSAVRELDEELLVVKVAKTVSGATAALAGAELTAFRNYLLARRLPGVKLNVVSNAPDTVLYTYAVLFNPRYDQVALQAAIAAALVAFRNNFAFDALLYAEQMKATVMAMPGVVDVTGSVTVSFSSGGSVSLADSVELPAGYFNYDVASSLSLTPAP